MTLAAQRTVTIPDVAKCPSCEIIVERTVTINTATGAGALSAPKSVSVDSRGRFYVLDWRDPARIAVYESNGDFIKDLGRAGEGPGEFTHIDVTRVGAGDSLYVFEPFRMTVLDSTGAYGRSSPLVGRKYSVAWMDRHAGFIMSANIPTRDLAGLFLHTVNMAGNIERSFGGEEVLRPDRMNWGASAVTSLPRGGVLSVARYQFVIDEWSPSLEHTKRLVRASDWFPADIHVQTVVDAQHPRYPIVKDIQASDRIALVLVNVPHADWRRLYGRDRSADGGGLFQTRIEAIDLDRDVLLADALHGIEAYGFIAKDLVYAIRIAPPGLPFTDIWRVRMTGMPPTRKE